MKFINTHGTMSANAKSEVQGGRYLGGDEKACWK